MFGAKEGAFLGHVVSMQGIKPCPEKAEAVMKLQSPQTLKEAQSLNRKLASLNKFLSKSAKKTLPFFKTLKRCVQKSDFQWTPEAERAFQNMKKCIAELPMVTAPKPKEELIMYLCTAKEAGIHISGPFPEAQGRVKFLIIAIDYFTKWIEAKPVVTITGSQVREAQYQAKVEEVPHVLWAHRTMIKTSNGDTPFSLTYGTEAVIPIEIGMPLIRCEKVNQAKNDEGILLNLDILEEIREKAADHEARNKAKIEKYYNAKVRSTSFRPRDFVYRSNKASHAK
ncbi:reverse transcriptase domain-containing protein [Tanacetum coccineum]